MSWLMDAIEELEERAENSGTIEDERTVRDCITIILKNYVEEAERVSPSFATYVPAKEME